MTRNITIQKIRIVYPKLAIKDLCTVGINPLRCVICQAKPKREKKSTCGDEDCMHKFFANLIVPDTDETRILK